MADRLPNLDYTSRDFEGIRQSLLDYAATAFPNWVPSSEGDFGVLMVELFAYMGDIMSYYIDRAQNEAYLPTATQKSSVVNIAQLLGYRPGTGTPATGTIVLVPSAGAGQTLLPKGTRFATTYVDSVDSPIYFELSQDTIVPAYNAADPNYSLAASAVVAPLVEGETKQADSSGTPLVLGQSTGLPDQVFRISTPNVYNDSVEVFVAGERWSPIDYIIDATPTDHRYTVSIDAEGYTVVRFGDGINGLIPPIGLSIGATWRVGVGSEGNVGPGRVVTMFQPVPGVSIKMLDSNTSLSSQMSGGADPESIEEIRASAPKVFNTQQRAVALEDFEAFALSVPGISKAKAVAQYFSSVTVFIVGSDGNAPTEAQCETVRELLLEKALAGVSVNVYGPVNFVDINFGADTNSDHTEFDASGNEEYVHIEAWPTYQNATVLYNAQQAIKSLLAFSNVDLGHKLTLAEVYSTLMAVEGVRYAYVPYIWRADASPAGNQDIQLLPYEFPRIGTILMSVSGGIS